MSGDAGETIFYSQQGVREVRVQCCRYGCMKNERTKRAGSGVKTGDTCKIPASAEKCPDFSISVPAAPISGGISP